MSRRAEILAFALIIAGAGCAGERGCADLHVTTLASTQHELGAVAVSDAFVYWIDRGTADDDYATGAVVRIPRAGGDPVILASDRGNLLDLAVDEASVYWTHPGGPEVMKVPKAGGAAEVIARGERAVGSVAVDRAFVYFAERAWNGAVFKVPKAGGSREILAADQRFPEDLVADADAIYWTAVTARDESAIVSTKLAGGAPRVIVEHLVRARSIAVDEENLYFVASESGDGAARDLVERVPKAGGAPQVIADGKGIGALAIDARNVYWVADRTGQVLGAPKAGGAAVVIAERQNGPGAIAVDDAGIYWTTDATSTRGVKGERHDAAVRVAAKH